MTGINDTVSTYEALGLTRPTADKKTNNEELGSEQFMELMLAQMRNQDPLKPMENGEFIAQIAQFSTVTGIQELQNSFDSLSSSLQSNQALQASTLVGRTVAVPSSELALFSEGGAYGHVELPASTTSLKISIFDGAGQLVRSVDAGGQAAGEVDFSWDGYDANGNAMPAGTYTIKAEAAMDGKVEALNTYVYAAVQSVDLRGSSGGIRLNLAGLGTADFADVKQIM